MPKQKFSKMKTVNVTGPLQGQIRCVNTSFNCNKYVLNFDNGCGCFKMNLCDMLKEVKHNG